MIKIDMEDIEFGRHNICSCIGNVEELDYKLKLTDEDRKRVFVHYYLLYDYKNMVFTITPLFYRTEAVLNQELEIDDTLNKIINKTDNSSINSYLSPTELKDIFNQFKEKAVDIINDKINSNFK